MCSMGTIEDHEAYQKARNDPKIMDSPEVKDPSSIKPSKLGKSSQIREKSLQIYTVFVSLIECKG